MTWTPGRDRHAVRHPGPQGRMSVPEPRHVVVVGGGIAGLAAAATLTDHRVRVTLVEATDRLGGRVASWPVGAGRTMSRGFHAFFRQYYTLRALLRRVDPGLSHLVPVADYPLTRPDGVTDSFANIPSTPPWSLLEYVRRSPTITASDLVRVNVPAALELVSCRFPESLSAYDGQSAADFLDRLRFPASARDLALEVFARSFFADPRDFSAGELVAMFHTYFAGSAEGLLFDVPDDDYDRTYWAPLGRYLAGRGVNVRTSTTVASISGRGVVAEDGHEVAADAVVLATDPAVARRLLARTDLDSDWVARVERTVNAPPFVVVRLWLDGLVDPSRRAFLGTSGFGRLDNVTVLERFEATAAGWSAAHRGSVVELHAYAVDGADAPGAVDGIVEHLMEQMFSVYPETADLGVAHREVLVRADCGLVTPAPWADRPTVTTPDPGLVLAGDWVRCPYPVALMERAAVTGTMAANALLSRWGAAGNEVWTVPMKGLLAGPPSRR